MIKLRTECNECIHFKMCRYVGSANTLLNKLKNTNFGTGSNDDYSWDKVSSNRNVNIEFSCPDFTKNVIVTRNGEGEKNI